jgi:hypothetical protein
MTRLCAFVLAASLAPSFAFGQTIGTFRWQLQSYCNVLSLVVTQNAGVFTLDGFDDQCGATTRAPVIGLATPNPNGTIEFGLTIVATPGAAPVHVAAGISLATLGGTWRDSAGNSGDFVFTTGPGSGGLPRPLAGAIGAASVNPSQVQLRISGNCPSGSFMQGVQQNGSVSCASESGDITAVGPGMGLTGGGASGEVSLGLQTMPSGAYVFFNESGFVARSTTSVVGLIPVSGAGTRAMWYPGKAAFRAGRVGSTEWNDENVGVASVAFGGNTVARGAHSMATGEGSVASGAQSVALGHVSTASGSQSLSVGDHTSAIGNESVALGNFTVAQGHQAVAMGFQSQAGGNGSVALGSKAITSAAAHGSFVFADQSSDDAFTSPAANEFGVRAAGGVYLYTSGNLSTGCSLPAGSGTWACTSDRNRKEHFEPVDGELVLTKLRAMPIERWSYRSEPGVTHVGPVAQDFHAAFGLGVDDKTIGHLDLSGISLRAIQALEERTRDLHEAVVRENDVLRAELAQLRALIDRLLVQR